MADLITLARAKSNLANLSTSSAEDDTLEALIAACSEAIHRYCGHAFSVMNHDEWYAGTHDSRLILNRYPIIEVQRIADERVIVMRGRNVGVNERATVMILPTGLKLARSSAGVSTSDSSITWAAYPTIRDVVNAINALGNGWQAEVLADHGPRASADLYPDAAARTCLGQWLDIALSVESLTDWQADLERGWLWRAAGWPGGANAYRIIYQAGYAVIPADVQEACAQWVAALFWLTKENPAIGPTLPPPGVRNLLASYRHRRI